MHIQQFNCGLLLTQSWSKIQTNLRDTFVHHDTWYSRVDMKLIHIIFVLLFWASHPSLIYMCPLWIDSIYTTLKLQKKVWVQDINESILHWKLTIFIPECRKWSCIFQYSCTSTIWTLQYNFSWSKRALPWTNTHYICCVLPTQLPKWQTNRV